MQWGQGNDSLEKAQRTIIQTKLELVYASFKRALLTYAPLIYRNAQEAHLFNETLERFEKKIKKLYRYNTTDYSFIEATEAYYTQLLDCLKTTAFQAVPAYQCAYDLFHRSPYFSAQQKNVTFEKIRILTRYTI